MTLPQRTCVGCRLIDEKPALLRIVSGEGGGVEIDGSGSAAGRGAYVHRNPRCIEAATRKDALANALKTGIGPDELGRLRTAMSQGAL